MPGIANAALAVIGAVAVLNLVLTLALVRRLRAVESSHDHGGEPIPEVLPAPGLNVGGFAHADLSTGRRTVVMLTPTCPPCQTLLDTLTADAGRYRRDALILMIGTPAETAAMAERLAGYDTVAVSEHLAETAFKVKGFPAVLSVHDGIVVGSSHELPVLV
ncbi:hypothetical protein [Catellatospora chokoriensis]|uniref:Uncharacterized protein n=1 Tax=Catellatospora chokoriensis TaxID=310353 RepID=A0A8J3K8Y8_9ACTN|nr:hypothetical protein [Catellatospora chokoriensis]GIF92850.1 hypothetical protein Cch02nite_62940 [Catellatospora chokoriensis]